MKAAQPTNPQQSTSLGLNLRKVKIQQMVPSRGVAICVDVYNHSSEVPYRVQASKGRIPLEGEVWYVDRSLGNMWTFRAFVATSDGDFQSFPTGLTLPDGQQILVGTVPSSVTATIGVRRANSTDAFLGVGVAGDTSSRWAVYPDGKTEWGPGGTTTRDTNLYRSAANVLSTDDTLTVGTYVLKQGVTWHTPTLNSGYTQGEQSGSSQDIQYRIDNQDNIVIVGACHANTTTPGSTIFTLSSGFRPSGRWRVPTVTNHGGTYAAASAIIETSGVVTIDPVPTASATDIYLQICIPLGNIT